MKVKNGIIPQGYNLRVIIDAQGYAIPIIQQVCNIPCCLAVGVISPSLWHNRWSLKAYLSATAKDGYHCCIASCPGNKMLSGPCRIFYAASKSSSAPELSGEPPSNGLPPSHAFLAALRCCSASISPSVSGTLPAHGHHHHIVLLKHRW